MMVRFQAAHVREIESMQKELRKMNRKFTTAARDAQADEEAAGGARGAPSPLRRLQAQLQQESIPGAVEAPFPVVPGDAAPALRLQEADEDTPAREVSDRVSDLSDGSFEDPFVLKEKRLPRGDTSFVCLNDGKTRQSYLSEFMNKYFNNGVQSRKDRASYKIVKSVPFSIMSYCAIIANSLFIGVSMQLQMANVRTGSPMQDWPNVVEICFVVFFTFELVCKVIAEDVYIFFGSDWHWNVLDTILEGGRAGKGI